jgi:hypothetical protein
LGTSLYHNGTFPSGTNWDNYFKWCDAEQLQPRGEGKLVNAAVTTDSVAATTTTTRIVTGETATAAPATTK